jgi:hypothetical protein
MTRRHDAQTPELPFTARARVRLPDALAPVRVFQGWGPGLGR